MKGSKTQTIIAVTALVVSLLAATPLGHAAGRLVLAKSSVGTAQLKKNAVTSVKVKNGSLLAGDFKAGQLPSGPPGPKGDPGAQGAPGSAVAYARIVVTASEAVVDASRSKGVSQTNVTRRFTGLTCFEGLAFTPKSAVASVDFGASWGGPAVFAAVVLPSANLTTACGAGAQAAVVTFNSNSNVDGAYYVIFE